MCYADLLYVYEAKVGITAKYLTVHTATLGCRKVGRWYRYSPASFAFGYFSRGWVIVGGRKSAIDESAGWGRMVSGEVYRWMEGYMGMAGEVRAAGASMIRRFLEGGVVLPPPHLLDDPSTSKVAADHVT